MGTENIWNTIVKKDFEQDTLWSFKPHFYRTRTELILFFPLSALLQVTKPLRRPGDRADSVDPLCCFLPEGVARSLGMTSSTHYAFMYIIYKLLTITNLALQLFFLHVFLDTNVLLHGFRVFYNIVLQQSQF